MLEDNINSHEIAYWELRRKNLTDKGARQALIQIGLGPYIPAYLGSKDKPQLWPALARHMFNSRKKKKSKRKSRKEKEK